MDTNALGPSEAMIEAIADPSRRAILTMLCDGPASVSVLAGALPVSRPAVSQHLKVLKEVGLVADRAEGTRRIYHVRPESLEAVRAYFDDFWQKSLMAFRLAAEAATDAAAPPDADADAEGEVDASTADSTSAPPPAAPDQPTRSETREPS